MDTPLFFAISAVWTIVLGIPSGVISAYLFDKWRRRDAVDDLRFAALSEMIDDLVDIAQQAEKWRGPWHDNPHHVHIRQYGENAYKLGGFPAMQLLAEAAEARAHDRSVGGRIDKVWSGIGWHDRRGVWVA